MGERGEWKKISSVEEQDRFWIIWCLWKWKIESTKSTLSLCWELCRHFLAFMDNSACCSFVRYPFSPIISPKKVLINISYCISKQSTCKLFYISSSTFQIHLKNFTSSYSKISEKLNIYPWPDFTMWTSKGRAERGETMGCAQSKRVRSTKPGCVSFLLLQTNAGIRHDCSEELGVLKLLAGSKIIWPRRQERVWRLSPAIRRVISLWEKCVSFDCDYLEFFEILLL